MGTGGHWPTGKSQHVSGPNHRNTPRWRRRPTGASLSGFTDITTVDGIKE